MTKRWLTRGALALAVLLLVTATPLVRSSIPAADAAPLTTKELVQQSALTNFLTGIVEFTRAEALELAEDNDLLIGQWRTYQPHMAAMKLVNPNLRVLLYQKGTTAGDDEGTKYPDAWYLRDAQGRKVVSDPWGSYLMDPREPGWRDRVAEQCLEELERAGYDGCFLDVMGTGVLSILASTPVQYPGGPEFTREVWHPLMQEMATELRAAIPAEVDLMSNSLTAGRRYFDERYPSWQLADAMGASLSEVWLRTAYDAPTKFRDLKSYRWSLDMLPDASSRGNQLLVAIKLWASATEAQRLQWRQFSYATFLLGTDGSHYWAYTDRQGELNQPHPLDDFDIGVPSAAYQELAGGVFRRTYSQGVVLTNAEAADRMVTLPAGTYVDVGGATYSGQVLLAGHHGLLLQKVEAAVPPGSPDPTPGAPTPSDPSVETCVGYAATIVGTAADDVLIGTSGNDVIVAGGGNDQIEGRGGHDIVCAGEGDDVVTAGLGDDRVFGGPGNDKILGGDGDDVLFGAQGNDILEGGAGDDGLHGHRGADVLRGGDGADRLFGYADNDRIFGGLGPDRIHGNYGDDYLDGEAGDDRIFGYGDADEMIGGPGSDLMVGNFGDDRLIGDAGNDFLYGSDGADVVLGAAGDDRVEGNSGDDEVSGGDGADRVDGGIGVDICRGDAGADQASRCETLYGFP